MLDRVVGSAGRDVVVDVPILEGGISRGVAEIPRLQVIERSGCSGPVDQADHSVGLSSLQKDDTDPSVFADFRLLKHVSSHRFIGKERMVHMLRHRGRTAGCMSLRTGAIPAN